MKYFIILLLWSLNTFAASGPHGYSEYCERVYKSPVCKTTDIGVVADKNELEKVNKEVNKNIHYVPDIVRYDRYEYWTVAQLSGDCEDYALRKIQDLQKDGVNPITMRLAAVTVKMNTRWLQTLPNELHIVLVVKDKEGNEWILDNLHNEVLTKEELHNYYNWSIQELSGSKDWRTW